MSIGTSRDQALGLGKLEAEQKAAVDGIGWSGCQQRDDIEFMLSRGLRKHSLPSVHFSLAFREMIPEDDEIREVRTEDERRGKRPIDIAARKRRLLLQRKFKEALEGNDVELFKEAIINDLGWLPGTPEFERVLKIWYAHHGRGRS